MNKLYVLLIVGIFSILSACKEKPPTLVGDDKDAHGCLPSAGYQWCGNENKCVRSWELAKEKALDLNADGFNQYCNKKPI